MNVLVILLRLVHILSGVFWVGGTLISSFFLAPAVAATGEAGQKMMAHIIMKGRMTARIMAAAGLTVLAGAALYWKDSIGLTSAWMTTATGWGFGIGALFALAGLATGSQVGINMNKLGRLATAAQGKPSPEQLAYMQAIQQRTSMFSTLTTVALIIALACMATARYWGA